MLCIIHAKHIITQINLLIPANKATAFNTFCLSIHGGIKFNDSNSAASTAIAS